MLVLRASMTQILLLSVLILVVPWMFFLDIVNSPYLNDWSNDLTNGGEFPRRDLRAETYR
ncbi:hypothetical protein RUM43_004775 [Polyplax serrata]|uniref:Uncharacterized protein n=1 Tax=Polyplax serrata TaxID=468196 RepID=A0AAN8XMG2_POLSC